MGVFRGNDKQRAVENALKHPRAASLSNVEIASHCGVNEATIRKYRPAIFGNSEDKSSRTVTRKGTTYPMKTANIGESRMVIGK